MCLRIQSHVQTRCTTYMPCGREFSKDNAYGIHQRSCKHNKKRLSGVLEKAKDIFAQKKQKLAHASLATTVMPAVQLPADIEVCSTISVFG